jgi:hypothetical protein
MLTAIDLGTTSDNKRGGAREEQDACSAALCIPLVPVDGKEVRALSSAIRALDKRRPPQPRVVPAAGNLNLNAEKFNQNSSASEAQQRAPP